MLCGARCMCLGRMGTDGSKPPTFCAYPMGAEKGAESPQPKSDVTPSSVVGYVRVSTGEQAEAGIGLDSQRHRVAAYCAAHGLVLARVEADEGLSAKAAGNRPGLQRALVALRRGEVAGLVAVRLDRLSRTTRDVLDLVAAAEREGWALHSIDVRLDSTTPTCKFTRTILAALAQLEREQIGERTRAAMAEIRRQGRRTSRFAAFGSCHKEGRLVPVEEEQRLLRRILELRSQGLGPRRIANTLNSGDLANPRSGRPWHYGSIKAILRTVERQRSSGDGA